MKDNDVCYKGREPGVSETAYGIFEEILKGVDYFRDLSLDERMEDEFKKWV
jgi:hypothetical protein